MVAASKSTSSHRRPRVSPRLNPSESVMIYSAGWGLSCVFLDHYVNEVKHHNGQHQQRSAYPGKDTQSSQRKNKRCQQHHHCCTNCHNTPCGFNGFSPSIHRSSIETTNRQ